MLRVMMDSDSIDALSPTVELLATYSDLVANPGELRRRFPSSQLILIDRGLGDPSGEASIIDIETGAYKVDHLPGWLDRKRHDGIKYLTSYVNRSTLAAVDALGDAGKCFRWVATLDGIAHIEGFRALEAPAAVQNLSADLLGVHADLSLVYDAGWNPAPEADNDRHARELARLVLEGVNSLTTEAQQLATLLTSQR